MSASPVIRCQRCWASYAADLGHDCPADAAERAADPRVPRWEFRIFVRGPMWRSEVRAFLDEIGEAAGSAKIIVDPVMGEVLVWWRELG